MASLAVINIAELTTNDSNAGVGPLGRLHDAGLVFEDGFVAWLGASAMTPAADLVVDAAGSAVIPGFVDSHTHLVFGGDRADEFVARMSGEPYAAGGILSTVSATRDATRSELDHQARRRHSAMKASGTTTVEVKSGYDLTVEGERRLLEVAAGISDEVTFLGAHVVPVEFESRRDNYVSLVAGEMLERCAPIARWADAFCDVGAFSVDECREILSRAASAGLGLRVHANQLAEGGGVQLAVELKAASVDHCTYVSAADLASLADSDVVATLLPSAEFSTRSAYSDARRLIDAGITVALATDCNPGTSYVTSMPFVMALAVRELHMSPDEALFAATLGGARALRRGDIGRLTLGARGDAVILDAPRAAHVAYRPGADLVRVVIEAGSVVA